MGTILLRELPQLTAFAEAVQAPPPCGIEYCAMLIYVSTGSPQRPLNRGQSFSASTARSNAMLGKLTGLVLVAAVFHGIPALAGVTGSSHGSLTFEKSEHVNSERGSTNVVTRHVSGTSHGADKGGPMDEATFQCHVTFVVEKGKPLTRGSGYCHGIVAAGDTWAMLLSGDEKGGKWSFVEGTGRYEMIKGSGTWRHEGSADSRSERYEWSGNWELKE
jgi:hypothetical protein